MSSTKCVPLAWHVGIKLQNHSPQIIAADHGSPCSFKSGKVTRHSSHLIYSSSSSLSTWIVNLTLMPGTMPSSLMRSMKGRPESDFWKRVSWKRMTPEMPSSSDLDTVKRSCLRLRDLIWIGFGRGQIQMHMCE